MRLSNSLDLHAKQARLQDEKGVFILTATEVGQFDKGLKLSRDAFQKVCGMD